MASYSESFITFCICKAYLGAHSEGIGHHRRVVLDLHCRSRYLSLTKYNTVPWADPRQ